MDEKLIELMDEKNCRPPQEITVPNSPGLYCIRIKKQAELPKPYSDELKLRGHDILYIGIARKSLNRRFLNQELQANGHGTFFRSLGAILGYHPPEGSLTGMKNKRNYKFSEVDEGKIISWINKNLVAYCIEFEGDFGKAETELIEYHLPLLNIAKNPKPLKCVIEARNECVRIANSHTK